MGTAEQRQAHRIKAFIGARIIFNDGQSTLDCLIRDLSETGARLCLSTVVTLPDCFDLIIPKKRLRLRAQVVWKRGDELGVTFDAEDVGARRPLPNGEAALRARIMALEAEVARLQRRLRELTEEVADHEAG